MLASAADAAYREMNRVETELAERLRGRTPMERFDRLILSLKVLRHLGHRFVPDRTIPNTRISLL